MDITSTEYMYSELGISKEILELGQKTEAELKERFLEFDRTAEYNQLKVIRAMQEARVSEACLLETTGYGYNDIGRDTLEAVYAAAWPNTSASTLRSCA